MVHVCFQKFKATTAGRNVNFHTTSWPPLVALLISVETYWSNTNRNLILRDDDTQNIKIPLLYP